jgi:hypothetical protein
LIKVSVLYPNTAGCKFDMPYYLTQHMPIVQRKLGAARKRIAVDEGASPAARSGRLRPMSRWAISIRVDRRLPERLRSAGAGNQGRHCELHQYPADHSDQRREEVIPPRPRFLLQLVMAEAAVT